jgi:hypothetical protein
MRINLNSELDAAAVKIKLNSNFLCNCGENQTQFGILCSWARIKLNSELYAAAAKIKCTPNSYAAVINDSTILRNPGKLQKP